MFGILLIEADFRTVDTTKEGSIVSSRLGSSFNTQFMLAQFMLVTSIFLQPVLSF